MHKSQLAGFILDCETEDLQAAADFWGAALGIEAEQSASPGEEHYRMLHTQPGDVHIEVQKVTHSSRVHIDIETDDIEAEVLRLEQLGAKRLDSVNTWVVMEAPTGQRFCVVRPQRTNFKESANRWE
jgi:predicted enzyme related to lactoylglutathione lyase